MFADYLFGGLGVQHLSDKKWSVHTKCVGASAQRL